MKKNCVKNEQSTLNITVAHEFKPVDIVDIVALNGV
jgi:hypothetical protein